MLRRLRPHLFLSTACVFWGGSFIATKIALESMGPFSVVAFRHAAASLVFLAWLAASAANRRTLGRALVWRRLPGFFLLSLLSVSAHHGLQTVGLQFTAAVNASVYAATAPIAIFVLGAAMLGERVSAGRIGGILLALIGVAFVTGFGALRDFDLGGRLGGDLLVFASILTWAVFTVAAKRSFPDLSAGVLMAGATVLGTLTLLPPAAYEIYTGRTAVEAIPVSGWSAVAFLGLTCSFLANVLYLSAVREIDAQKAGVYLYSIPPLTGLFAVLFLGEVITASLVSGAALVFAGLLLTQRS